MRDKYALTYKYSHTRLTQFNDNSERVDTAVTSVHAWQQAGPEPAPQVGDEQERRKDKHSFNGERKEGERPQTRITRQVDKCGKHVEVEIDQSAQVEIDKCGQSNNDGDLRVMPPKPARDVPTSLGIRAAGGAAAERAGLVRLQPGRNTRRVEVVTARQQCQLHWLLAGTAITDLCTFGAVAFAGLAIAIAVVVGQTV